MPDQHGTSHNTRNGTEVVRAMLVNVDTPAHRREPRVDKEHSMNWKRFPLQVTAERCPGRTQTTSPQRLLSTWTTTQLPSAKPSRFTGHLTGGALGHQASFGTPLAQGYTTAGAVTQGALANQTSSGSQKRNRKTRQPDHSVYRHWQWRT